MSASLQMAAFTVSNGIARIPTIFTREGVQNKGLKLFDELVLGAETLNGRPVTFWHPKDRTRETDSEKDIWIGYVSDVNPRKKDKVLHGFTNIYFEGAPENYQNAPPEFQQALRAGTRREGSVGYWAYGEPAEGEFNGVPYDRIERDLQFDHYAVGIPVGACSVAGGCGLGFDQACGCSIETPVEYDGEQWIKYEDFQGFIKKLNSQDLVRMEDVRALIAKHLDPEDPDVEGLKNGINPPPQEDIMAHNEEAQKEILRLEREKLDLETRLKDAETKAGKVDELEGKLGELTTTLEGLKPQIEELDQKKQKDAQDAETARVALVKEILEARGEEATDENLAAWKEWTPKQLETMKVSLGLVEEEEEDEDLDVDRRGLGIPTGEEGAFNPEFDPDKGIMVTEPIGDRLFGAPMPGYNHEGGASNDRSWPGLDRNYNPVKKPKKTK